MIIEDPSQIRARGHNPLVFTNGCFDILHVGHVDYLQKAAKHGKLLVALNTDESVARLKPGRPFVCLEDRMKIINALACVSYVTSFDEDTPLNKILEYTPDVLIKGADYAIEDIVGGKEVQSWGGAVMTIPLVEGRSTTSIRDKILLDRN